MIQLIKQKSFLLFCFAQLASRYGDGITTITVLYLIGSGSGTPFLVGLVIFAQYAPTTLFGFFTGVIADRFPKPYIMMGADIYRCLLLGAMSFFVTQPYILILFVFLAGIGTAFFYPARTSFIPSIVQEAHVPQAVGISQSIYSIMLIAGPGMAGLLLTLTSSANILLMAAIAYLISALLILFLANKGSDQKQDQRNVMETTKPSIFQEAVQGIKTVYHLPSLRFLILLIAQVMFAVGIFNTTSTSLLLQTFNVSQFHFGMIEAMVGLGALGGAILGAKILFIMRPGHLLFATSIFLGCWMIAVIPLDMLQEYWRLPPIYIWVLVIGVMNAFLNVPISSLFLSLTPAMYRGRAMSILQMSSNMGLLMGIILAGAFAHFFGVVSITAIAGGLITLIVVASRWTTGFRSLAAIPKKASTPSAVEETEEEQPSHS